MTARYILESGRSGNELPGIKKGRLTHPLELEALQIGSSRGWI
jgi:hypothetical protein